jgi:hypothetical protein
VLVRGLAEEVTPAHREELVAHTKGTGLTTWAPGEHGHWVRLIPQAISGRRIVPGERPPAVRGRRIPLTPPTRGARPRPAVTAPRTAPPHPWYPLRPHPRRRRRVRRGACAPRRR